MKQFLYYAAIVATFVAVWMIGIFLMVLTGFSGGNLIFLAIFAAAFFVSKLVASGMRKKLGIEGSSKLNDLWKTFSGADHAEREQ